MSKTCIRVHFWVRAKFKVRHEVLVLLALELTSSMEILTCVCNPNIQYRMCLCVGDASDLKVKSFEAL